MEGYPAWNHGRKGPDVHHVLGSKAGERRGGEDAAEDDDLLDPRGCDEFAARRDEAHGEKGKSCEPRPEYVVREQWILLASRDICFGTERQSGSMVPAWISGCHSHLGWFSAFYAGHFWSAS